MVGSFARDERRDTGGAGGDAGEAGGDADETRADAREAGGHAREAGGHATEVVVPPKEPHAPLIRLSLGCARSVFLPAGPGKRGVSVGVKGGGLGGRTWARAAAAGGLALVAAVVVILAGCCARAPELPPPHRLPAPADLTLPV